jgi:hypothetical protein
VVDDGPWLPLLVAAIQHSIVLHLVRVHVQVLNLISTGTRIAIPFSVKCLALPSVQCVQRPAAAVAAVAAAAAAAVGGSRTARRSARPEGGYFGHCESPGSRGGLRHAGGHWRPEVATWLRGTNLPGAWSLGHLVWWLDRLIITIDSMIIERGTTSEQRVGNRQSPIPANNANTRFYLLHRGSSS